MVGSWIAVETCAKGAGGRRNFANVSVDHRRSTVIEKADTIMASVIAAPLRPTILLVLSFFFSANAAVGQLLEAPQEIVADIDGDGKVDRAVVVLSQASDGALDLHVHFGSSNGNEPDFVKTSISGDRIEVFESREKATLSLQTCYGCGASKSYDETLTITYRNKTFLVSGYARYWEWYTRFGDGTDELLMGGCRINFLLGRGWTVGGDALQTETLVKERYPPVTLADWSFKKAPPICRFGNDSE